MHVKRQRETAESGLHITLYSVMSRAVQLCRSYNLLYFIHARKASQINVRNQRTIYANIKILLKALNATMPTYKI